MTVYRPRLRTPSRMFLGALFVGVCTSAAAQDANRAIEQVKGDVYRFQNDFHFAMFVVTDEGIVVTDPINADAVAWLKDSWRAASKSRSPT